VTAGVIWRLAARASVYDRVVKVAFRVSERASEVVETLRDVLGARVRLLDTTFGCVHAHVRKSDWVSFPDRTSLPAPPAGRASLTLSVNQRWTLQVTRDGSLEGNADALCAWAVKELASELSGELAIEPPRKPALRGAPPRGGGTSGPAELGIPLAWARRTRR
jgi:hypothetical protein